MSKALATLVRMHRWRLDEKRRAVGELERLRAGLVAQGEKLADELEAEKAAAGESLDASQTLTAYLSSMRERRARLDSSVEDIDRRLDAANAELAECFRTYKTHETALANRLRREEAEAERRQQLTLDEIALHGHRRQRRAGV